MLMSTDQAEGAWKGSTWKRVSILMVWCWESWRGWGRKRRKLKVLSAGPRDPDFMQIKVSDSLNSSMGVYFVKDLLSRLCVDST